MAVISDPVFQVTENGITAPTYAEILEYYKDQARQIFGDDIVLDNDSADGQLIAIFAAALSDVNAQAIATYNAFNPQTAKGAALDSVVKVNGLTRREATASQAVLRIIGQAGTQIVNGIAIDALRNRWLLPELVTIPASGEISVTARAEKLGSIEAPAGSIDTIGTPTLGWQSVTNVNPATVGVAVETDAEPPARQDQSTARESVSLWEGIVASLREVDGVVRVSGVNNDTGSADADGIPAHSIAMVVEGGEDEDIARTIFDKKGEGVATYGSTSVTLLDEFSNSNTVSFSRPTIVQIEAALSIRTGPGYNPELLTAIRQEMADYINSLAIGADVEIASVLGTVAMNGDVPETRFLVTGLTIARAGEQQASLPIEIEWNEAAACSPDDITITAS
jgi:uncharacterized phage protein gp47/JayE